MNILVCINQVPDTTARLGVCPTGEPDFSNASFIINPIDEKALTKALLLKEQCGGSVTLVNVGQQADAVLRKAFAVGADKMIRIDAPARSSLQVAKEIAHMAKEYELILCGNESMDYHGGMVGGLLAGLLGRNYVSNATAIEYKDGVVQVEREANQGRAVLTAGLPLVISVHKEILSDGEIRLPNMRNIMASRTAPLQVLPATEQVPLSLAKVEQPTQKSAVKMFSPSELDALIEELHSVKKVL